MSVSELAHQQQGLAGWDVGNLDVELGYGTGIWNWDLKLGCGITKFFPRKMWVFEVKMWVFDSHKDVGI